MCLGRGEHAGHGGQGPCDLGGAGLREFGPGSAEDYVDGAPVELDARTEALVRRIALMPVNQLQMMKLLVNQSLYSQGLHATQLIGTVFDGIARHTKEGYEFQGLAAREGFKTAVRARDEQFDG